MAESSQNQSNPDANSTQTNQVLFWRLPYRRRMGTIQKSLWLIGMVYLLSSIVLSITGYVSGYLIFGTFAIWTIAWIFGTLWRSKFRTAFWKEFPIKSMDKLN